ncbi:hypothetical protein RCL1_003668 [Eukaryota sp. TZLM3-RCL]
MSTEIPAHPEFDAKLKRWNSVYENVPLFDLPVRQWKDLSVHHFEGVSFPYEDSTTWKLLPRVYDIVEGHEGCYGAGGGLLHVLYFSRDVVQKTWTSDDLPNVEDFIELLKLSDQAQLASWFVTLDPCHQTLFRRQEDDDDVRDVLEELIELHDPQANFLASVDDSGDSLQCVNVLPHVRTSFPNFTKSRIVYFAPLVDGLHDGDCPQECPRDNTCFSSVLESDHDEPVAFNEMPRFAFWQTSNGDVIGLVTFDFMD